MQPRAFNITQISFRVPVSVDEMLLIMEKDRNVAIGDELYEKLNAVDGVYQVDYDGHFGPWIFFTLHKENHNDATLNKISKIINDYIPKK